MKELSIEEKARRYDEAKYIMKGYLESGNAGVIAENTIKKAFPELSESEDERIRKKLLEYFKSFTSETFFNGVPTSDAIAWLEKKGQKQQKTPIWKHWKNGIAGNGEGELIYLIKQGYTYSLSSCLCFECDYIELSELDKLLSEKQGEQKPDTNCLLSWSEMDEKMLQSLEGIVKDYWAKAEQEKNEIKIREASKVSYFLKTIQKSPLCWIKCSDKLPNRDGIYLVVTDGMHNDVYDMARYDSIEGWHKASEIIYWMPIPQLNNKSIIEQKPADNIEKPWSEEDNEHFERILKELKNQWQRPSNRPYLDEIESDYNWLKSLKDRVQPKQEWSKEDEEMKALAIDCIESMNPLPTSVYTSCIKWLKSLKPQSQWKPSDEQLEALESATENCAYSEHQDCLRKLLKQLKKLRGE